MGENFNEITAWCRAIGPKMYCIMRQLLKEKPWRTTLASRNDSWQRLFHVEDSLGKWRMCVCLTTFSWLFLQILAQQKNAFFSFAAVHCFTWWISTILRKKKVVRRAKGRWFSLAGKLRLLKKLKILRKNQRIFSHVKNFRSTLASFFGSRQCEFCVL